MDLLLDTHILLWWLADDAQLTDKACELIAAPENMAFVSAASAWEIAIKQTLGRLTIEGELDAVVIEEGFTTLPFSFKHAAETQLLPPIHNDPFDRMLVAQARVESLHLLTADRRILKYPANVISC
jgi:PIN domain nuclease of toxin-antitoxin system